jgi:uncharacterized protein YjdB
MRPLGVLAVSTMLFAACVETAAPTSIGSVTIDPTPSSIAVGAQVQLFASVLTPGGDTLQGASVAWSSSNTAAATITSAGLLSGVAVGTATIKASASDARGQASSAFTLSVVLAARSEDRLVAR